MLLRLGLVGATLGLLALVASEDGVAQEGTLSIVVSESVGVSDSPLSLPPASSEATEMVLVGDTALVLPPAEILVAESISVTDTVPDSDSDGFLDLGDNCPFWPNPSQTMRPPGH